MKKVVLYSLRARSILVLPIGCHAGCQKTPTQFKAYLLLRWDGFGLVWVVPNDPYYVCGIAKTMSIGKLRHDNKSHAPLFEPSFTFIVAPLWLLQCPQVQDPDCST